MRVFETKEPIGRMNIFRLAGDLSHLVAIIILLIKIWKTRSCAGGLCNSVGYKRNKHMSVFQGYLAKAKFSSLWFSPHAT